MAPIHHSAPKASESIAERIIILTIYLDSSSSAADGKPSPVTSLSTSSIRLLLVRTTQEQNSHVVRRATVRFESQGFYGT